MAGALRRATRLTPEGGSSLRVAPLGGGQVPSIHFNSSAARAMSQLSQTFAGVADDLNSHLDKEAEAQGQFQGAIDGASGDFNLQSWSTIRGRAYNNAAADAFVNTLEVQTADNLMRIRKEYASDPDGMRKAIDAYGSGVTERLGQKFPQAVPMYRRRLQAKALPAIEQANDLRFKLTREKAEATGIQRDLAVDAEIKATAPDLFSDNPRRSQAAAATLQQLREDHLRFYKQTDAAGRPLFSPKEIALADQEFYKKTMTLAARQWFRDQPDKAQAYMQLEGGSFKMNMNLMGDIAQPPKGKGVPRGVRNNNPGNIEFGSFAKGKGARGSDGRFAKFSTPHEGIRAMGDLLMVYQEKHGLSTVRDMIGRWAPEGENDSGAYASRVAQAMGISPDQQVDLAANPQAMSAMVAAMIDVENGYQAYSQSFVARALAGDNEPPVESSQQHLDITTLLDEKTVDALKADFRAEINFENSMADRAEREQEKRVKEAQELNEAEFFIRYADAGGKDEATGQQIVAPSVREIHEAMRNGNIEPKAAQSLIKVLQSEPVVRSDPEVYREAIKKIYDGEDAKGFIYENLGQLRPNDAKTLLAENKRENGSAEGDMSDQQKYYHDLLKQTLTPDSLMASLDSGHEMRKMNALVEYRARVSEGEQPETAMRDILDRSNRQIAAGLNLKINNLLSPRFSVPGATPGRIDIHKSAVALKQAYDDGQISATAFERQKALLAEWMMHQEAADKAAARKAE
jgi:hypothetical protein